LALPLFYRFYLLRAEGRIADRHEGYFADDAAAIANARRVIEDFPRLEIWCGPRKVVTLSREEMARLQPPVAPRPNHRAALLVSRNERLLQQATAMCHRTEALHAPPTSQEGWARLTWQHHERRNLSGKTQC
jgi:hypothetical protein